MENKTGINLRRYVMFLIGMTMNAVGIAFVTRAGLGTSPISGVPFVLSLVTGVSLGIYTFVFNMLYLVLEAVLRKEFTKGQLVQIPFSIFFSLCIDIALRIIPTQYGHFYLYSLIYLVIGVMIASFGIFLEVTADVIMLPAEAFVRALSRKTHASFGNMKIGFDMTLTCIAMVLAVINFHKLNGVREGTLIVALAMGQVIKFYTHYFKPSMERLLAPASSRMRSAQATKNG